MCGSDKVDDINFFVAQNITDISEELGTTASSDRGG